MNAHRLHLAAALRPAWIRPVLTRLGRWPRRLLAAALLLAALATELAGRAHVGGPAPPRGGSATVLAAAHDLSVGSVLDATDVRPVRLPVAAVPAHALTGLSSVVGRRVASPVRRGEPLTDVRLAGPGLAAGLAGQDRVAVPVRLADPAVAALLRPGSRIDLLGPPAAVPAAGSDPADPADSADGVDPADGVDRAAPAGRDGPGPATVLASDVPVLAVVPVDSDRDASPLLVVAATPATARRLAGAAGDAGLTVTLRPP